MGGCIIERSKAQNQRKCHQSLQYRYMPKNLSIPSSSQNDMETTIYVKNSKNRLPSSYKIDPFIGNCRNEKNEKKMRQIKSDEVPRKNRFQQKSINIESKQNKKEEEAAEQRLANSLIIIKLDEDEEEVKQVQTKIDRNRTTRNFQKETNITLETSPKFVPFCKMEQRVDVQLPKRQPGPRKLKQFVSDDLQLRQTFMPIKIQNEQIQFKIKRYEAGLSVISEVSRRQQKTLQSGLRLSDSSRLSNKSTASRTIKNAITKQYTLNGNSNVNNSKFGPKLQFQNNPIPTLICE